MTWDRPPPGLQAAPACWVAAPTTPPAMQVRSPPSPQEPRLDTGTPRRCDLSALTQEGSTCQRCLSPLKPPAVPVTSDKPQDPTHLALSVRAQGAVSLLHCHLLTFPHLLSHPPTSHRRGWRGELLGGRARDSSQVAAPGRAAWGPTRRRPEADTGRSDKAIYSHRLDTIAGMGALISQRPGNTQTPFLGDRKEEFP